MASEILTGIQAEDAELQTLDDRISEVVTEYETAAQTEKDAYTALEDKYNTLIAASGASVDPAELSAEKQAIADSTAKVAAIIARLGNSTTSNSTTQVAPPATPDSTSPVAATTTPDSTSATPATPVAFGVTTP
ncbi:MAG: hypothetical protein HWQ38_08075 [Nostoc sp. NMS7]|uniref:hypothetical protein n=1 Tax=Nostoc sp. NMS7 TaxID=2815391 RepID=UPI0025D12A63|nr:hypothetical protein [Nostoc sp. NMS7]MBN3946439.1 hypothetical protein [Nostoc sp. NMS7]